MLDKNFPKRTRHEFGPPFRGFHLFFFLYFGFRTLVKINNFSSCPKTELKCDGGDTRIDFIQLFIHDLYELLSLFYWNVF